VLVDGDLSGIESDDGTWFFVEEFTKLKHDAIIKIGFTRFQVNTSVAMRSKMDFVNPNSPCNKKISYRKT
jgi:hypothetical protein